MSDAIPFVFRKFSMLVDGTIRMVVDVEPNDTAGVFSLFSEPNVSGAMVRLDEAAVREAESAESEEIVLADYGEEAKVLKLSGFFRAKDVWPNIGTDEEFLEWVRGQKCVVCGREPPSEPAHVRRIANGAGTGIKPQYSAVPLCRAHHAIQHQKGESAIGGKGFLDKQRIIAVERWCWEKLKTDFGFSTWKDVPPNLFRAWATYAGVDGFLPVEYKEKM